MLLPTLSSTHPCELPFWPTNAAILHAEERFMRCVVKPAILFRRRFEGIVATSCSAADRGADRCRHGAADGFRLGNFGRSFQLASLRPQRSRTGYLLSVSDGPWDSRAELPQHNHSTVLWTRRLQPRHRLLGDLLVNLKIKGELAVVFLDNDSRSLHVWQAQQCV